MALQWCPQMDQSLPAKVKADLVERANFVEINEEIARLRKRVELTADKEEIKTIYNKRNMAYQRRRQLIEDELQKWQESQPYNVNDKSSIMSRLTFFDRIRHLDPSRDKLASLLFLEVPLRSPEGRAAIHNMITLYKENPRVAYRPSLKPKDGHCPVASCNRWIESYVISEREKQLTSIGSLTFLL